MSNVVKTKVVSEKVEKIEKFNVKLDTPFEMVLEYDKKGVDLLFSLKAEEFPVYSEEQLELLSGKTVTRWQIVKEHLAQAEAEKEDLGLSSSALEELAIISRSANYANMSQRTALEASPEFKREFVTGICAPESIQSWIERGWSVVTNEVKSKLNPSGKGLHKVVVKGQTDGVLMKIPRKLLEKYQKEGAARVEARLNGVQEGEVDSVAKTGLRPYVETPEDKRSWVGVEDAIQRAKN